MLKIFLLFIFPLVLVANPSWLYTIKPTHSNEIVGYGIDKSLTQARQNAMSDIVKSISVHIESSTDITKSTNDGKYKKNVSSNTKTQAKATLTGIEFIRGKQIGDLWYVAARYDNSPLEIKFKKLLLQNLTNEKQDETQNKYLARSPLLRVLNSEIDTKYDYEIIRKDNLWQLKYKNILLPLSQANFYKTFSTQSTKNLSIQANKSIFRENDEMYFKIKSTKKGYLSILYVEHNGKVGVLTSNIKSQTNLLYPDLKSEDTFKISNPYNKPIQELYVVLHTEKPLDLSLFENVSENLLDESNYNFDTLLNVLNHTKYASCLIKIKY